MLFLLRSVGLMSQVCQQTRNANDRSSVENTMEALRKRSGSARKGLPL